MKRRLGLLTLVAIIAGCAFVLATVRSEWAEEWGFYLLLAVILGLVIGGLCTLVSFLLLWSIGWKAPWRHHLGRAPKTGPRSGAAHRVSRWVVHFYACWPVSLKQAFWSCCAALCLVVLIDWISLGNWWNEGAPGEIGWPAYTLEAAGVIFVVCVAWSRLPPSATKDARAGIGRKWLPGREWGELSALIRSVLMWLLLTSPAWFRVILAWLVAETSVPFAHLIVDGLSRGGPGTVPTVIAPRILAVLVIWLLASLAILMRGLYDMSRAFFPRLAAILVCPMLSAAHVWAFFRVALWL
jgi:hypothetical protein